MGATVNRSSALFGVTPSIVQPRLTTDASPGAHPWVCVWVVHSGTIPLKCPVRAQLSWLLARPTQLLGELGCTRLLHTYRPASSRAALDDNRLPAGCGVPCVNWLTIHSPSSLLRISSPTLKRREHHTINHFRSASLPFQLACLSVCMLVSSHACQLSITVCGCMSACHSQTSLPGRPRPSQWAPALLSGSQRMTT